MRASALVLVVAGCMPEVDVGTNFVDSKCPAEPWRPAVLDANALAGRWRFCGGTAHHQGAQTPTAFLGAHHLEFTSRQTLVFTDPMGVQLAELPVTLEPAARRLTVQAANNVEGSWRIERFDDPVVLQLSALDRWTFVRE